MANKQLAVESCAVKVCNEKFRCAEDVFPALVVSLINVGRLILMSVHLGLRTCEVWRAPHFVFGSWMGRRVEDPDHCPQIQLFSDLGQTDDCLPITCIGHISLLIMAVLLPISTLVHSEFSPQNCKMSCARAHRQL